MTQMLQSASNGQVTKTKIMYMAYVPHEQMSEFLALLVDNGLLTLDNQIRLYQITAKGKMFLEMYGGMNKCVEQESII